ncbi:hypothetical protein G3T14_07565 [Methylobacterium sp. BTF04]|uniref:hypothetical protein n=1 Tax=Methylobacterium sp. BTF04 TaxID=2708300 RepID=UPI0013D74015|nr:hypothetical protein [Methylobacterium sp. BTF04]NEU11985.1 hypothetical protein [Methylobacterium sp. BTF04]
MAIRPAFSSRRGRILAAAFAAVVGGLSASNAQAAPFAQGFARQPDAVITRVHDDYGYGGHHRGRDRGYDRGWGGGHRGWDHHSGRGERHGWGHRREGWGHHHHRHHGGGYRGYYPY